jgi:hypothetical protein
LQKLQEKSVKGLNKNCHWGGFNLIMMFIIIYGNMVMRSVIEENKSYYRNNNLIGEAISVDDW